MIPYYRSGVTAGVPIEPSYSIVLAGSDQMDEGLEDLNNPMKSAGDVGGDLI